MAFYLQLVFLFLFSFLFGWFANRIVRYFSTGKSVLRSALSDIKSLRISASDILFGFSVVLFSFLFVFLSKNKAGSDVFFSVVIFLVLSFSAAYDLKHKILPDVFSLIFVLFAFVSLFFEGNFLVTLPSGQDFFAGILVPLPFLLMWLASKGRWLGFGDIKLMVGMGWFLGLWQAIDAVVLGFWTATGIVFIMGAWIFVVKKFFKTKTFGVFEEELIRAHELPFGPFLIIGMFLVVLGVDVLATLLPRL